MRFLNNRLMAGLATIVLLVQACGLARGVAPTPTAAIVTAAVITTTPTPSRPAAVSPQIDSFHMLDPNNGWAISDTEVLRTSDGGTTWYNVTPPGVSRLGFSTASFYLAANIAWVVVPRADSTSGGKLCRTTDGGATWASVSVPFGRGSIQFLDTSNGWDLVELSGAMSHEAVAVFTTGDGGNTWSRVFIDDPTVTGSSDTLPLAGDKNGIAALDANHAWVPGAQPSPNFVYLYMSQDGGHTWTHQNVAIPNGYAEGMTSVSPPTFFGSTAGVLPVQLMANNSGVVFYNSRDAGQTWTASQPVAQRGDASVASMADFFVWDGGPDLNVSHDSGSTWTEVTPNINVHDTLASFQFVDANTGWALTEDANSHHSLYKTTDGGATWTALIP
ncbi:MAG: hypothetical protein ABSG98_11880 [Anaerolineales bacterium]